MDGGGLASGDWFSWHCWRRRGCSVYTSIYFLKIYLPHDNLQGVGSYQLAFLACDGSLRWHCCHSVLCVHLFMLTDLPALRQPPLGNDALTRACLCQVACVCLLVLEALPWVEDAC